MLIRSTHKLEIKYTKLGLKKKATDTPVYNISLRNETFLIIPFLYT